MSLQLGDVLFIGGPCDGTHGDVDDDQASAGFTSCKGTVYRLYLVDAQNSEYLAKLPGAAPPTQDYEPAGPTNPVDALLAWQVFGRKVGRNLPGYVNTTARLRRAIRQVGRP